MQQAANNTKEQFANSPDLSTELMNAIMDAFAQKQADLFTVSGEAAQAALAAGFEGQFQFGVAGALRRDSGVDHQHAYLFRGNVPGNSASALPRLKSGAGRGVQACCG